MLTDTLRIAATHWRAPKTRVNTASMLASEDRNLVRDGLEGGSKVCSKFRQVEAPSRRLQSFYVETFSRATCAGLIYTCLAQTSPPKSSLSFISTPSR